MKHGYNPESCNIMKLLTFCVSFELSPHQWFACKRQADGHWMKMGDIEDVFVEQACIVLTCSEGIWAWHYINKAVSIMRHFAEVYNRHTH